jgi:hypothetical protein
MKPDLQAIKRELSKLTDVEYLKKEITKIANEIRKFDPEVHLSPQAKERMKMLEKSFNDLRTRLMALEKQAETEVNRIIETLRKLKDTATAKKKSRKKTSAKKASSKKRS